MLPPLKVTHHPQKEATNIYRGTLDADIPKAEQTCTTVQESSDTLKGSHMIFEMRSHSKCMGKVKVKHRVLGYRE